MSMAQKKLRARPQTSLGFERDTPDLTHFVTQGRRRINSRLERRTSKNRTEETILKPSVESGPVKSLAEALKPFEKHEKRWQKLRYPSPDLVYEKPDNKPSPKRTAKGSDSRSSNNYGTKRASQSAKKQREVKDANAKSPNHQYEKQLNGTKRRVGKAWSAPDGFQRGRHPFIKPRLSEDFIGNNENPGNVTQRGKGSLEIARSSNGVAGKESLLGVEPLNSILEQDDVERYLDADQVQEVTKLQDSISHVSMDNLYLSDADDADRFDTDLEEDFPEPPPKEYDPSEKRTYLESCINQGIVPVTYLLKRLGERTLIMRHHGLGPHGTRPLANALLKNTCIEELDLTDNDLQADGGVLMALTLYENLYITTLDLSENFLKVLGGISIAKVLLTNTSLRKLVLKGNHFTDKVAKAFAEALKENRTLYHLDLSYNEFGELGGLYLGAGLGLNYGLHTLNLSWNSIRNKGAVSMAASLKTNESLKCLNLSWNGLAFVGALAFTRYLKINETLEDLDISNNRIGPKGAQRLAFSLKVNASLQCFRIGLNPIGDEGVSAILNATKQNSSLKFLGLEDITVSPKVHDEILKLEDERDIVIRTGGKTGHTQESPPPSGMELLVQFIQDNRLRLKDLFFQFDKDHSGDISREEFKAGLKETGIQMNEKQLDTLIETIDIDNSNTIEYSEILYGKELIMQERRFQRKVAIRTKEREKESIRLPKLKGFED